MGSSTSINAKRRSAHFRQWLPISLIGLIAATLYLYQLAEEGFWIDELTSVTDIQTGRGLPPNNLIRPLYYMLLSIWIQVSNHDAWLRGLAVLFAITSVFLVYQLGRRLAGEAEGLIAALILALSPLFINHAQEVRMYTMSTCLGLGGTVALTYALMSEPGKRPSLASMAGWAGLRLLAIFTVPLNLTLLIPDILLVGWRFRNQRAVLFDFGKWLLLIVVLWSPGVLSVVQMASPSSSYAQQGHVAGRRTPHLIDLVRTLKFFTVWPFSVHSNAIAAWFYKLFTGLLAGLLGAALIKNKHHNSSKLFWVAAWAFIPLGLIFGFSYISMSLWVTRYLLFVSPYIFILLAAGLIRVWRQWRIVAIAIAVAYTIAVVGGLVRYYTVQDRPNYKAVVQVINTNEQPGDVIIWSMYYDKALAHYYQGSAPAHQHILPSTLETSDLEQLLSDLPPIESRFWLATQVSSQSSPLLETFLAENFDILTHKSFAQKLDNDGSMEVFLLSPRSPDIETNNQ
ncbi:MAG: glycosyltransferase family 39 protein [Coleofasciculus sp. C1-SOL-03]|jgi:uncharacterized membrane protein|uniref:glycosyltransferase family 39 protein n=1 Tax=Coleofasciculus sp. C1-SOL-03 TaxID=3069522 RepID=UPI0032F920F0